MIVSLDPRYTSTMDNKLPDDRPLSEEERRRNLEALLAGEEIEEYFDAPPAIERVNERGELERVESAGKDRSKNPYRLPLILLGAFIVISLLAGVLTSNNEQEDTIDTPTGGVGSLDIPRE